MNVFVTGTDTDCGKTVISCALMAIAARQGHTVAGMKPIAAGAVLTADGLRNDDALAIQQACSKEIPYALINPVCYPEPTAPHLQAPSGVRPAKGGSDPINTTLAAYQQISTNADMVIVEGAGGWRVPLSDTTDMADLCLQLQLPVILVVGMRLGCINHALLTVEAIQNSGARLVGWIANQIDPEMMALEENIGSLKARIEAPLLGFVPWTNNIKAESIEKHLNLPKLL